MNITYKHIYLNFGVFSFMHKEMVTFIQLHTYKFALVYYQCSENKGAEICFAVTAKLICVFVFTYVQRLFSHDPAQIYTYSAGAWFDLVLNG